MPYTEHCAEVREDDDLDREVREYRAYIDAIRKRLGNGPENAALR
jgi:hypothetical protein